MLLETNKKGAQMLPLCPNVNKLPLCGPLRWSLKSCHDGSALSAQCRPTDALSGEQERGEQGSGPGASSTLPRIQIGQCVFVEGNTHTLTMNKIGSCQLNSSNGHVGKGHLVSVWGSQEANKFKFSQQTWLYFVYKRLMADPGCHVCELSRRFLRTSTRIEQPKHGHFKWDHISAAKTWEFDSLKTAFAHSYNHSKPQLWVWSSRYILFRKFLDVRRTLSGIKIDIV